MCECEPTVDGERNVDEVAGRTFTQAALFRGDMCTYTVEEAMTFVKPEEILEDNLRETLAYNKRKNSFLSPLKNLLVYEKSNPRREFTSICNFAAPGTPMSVTYLRNSSNIKFKFLKIINQAVDMFNTRAFMQWYDTSEFQDATGLEEVLKILTSEWIPEFGVEDTSNYPEAIIME